MRTKNTIIFSLISAFFLISLISIWKILATLQGLNINSFNIEVLFIFGFLISLAHISVGNKIKNIYKSIIFSLIFVLCDGYLIQKLPLWYNIGVFLILYFFNSKINKTRTCNFNLIQTWIRRKIFYYFGSQFPRILTIFLCNTKVLHFLA